jgi:leucyl/phenylalanyl-tRNA--protein transferase
VGGLYGISIGKIFFGESMFSYVSNASKFGFISLVCKLKRENYLLIDCQQKTNHLVSLGATGIKRSSFLNNLKINSKFPDDFRSWSN